MFNRYGSACVLTVIAGAPLLRPSLCWIVACSGDSRLRRIFVCDLLAVGFGSVTVFGSGLLGLVCLNCPARRLSRQTWSRTRLLTSLSCPNSSIA